MAISRTKVKIYIVDADTLPSTLTSADAIEGQIKSYDKSGGEKDVESDAVFGGFVDKEKPQSQYEFSLEIVPTLDDTDSASTIFDAMAYAADVTNAGIYTSAASTALQPADKMIVIEATDADGSKTSAWNNCSVTMLDESHNADDNKTYNMTMKLAPTTEDGSPNFMTGAVLATALPDWTALDK